MGNDVLIIYPTINEPAQYKTLVELGGYVSMLKRSEFDVRVCMLDEQPDVASFIQRLEESPTGFILYYLQPNQFAFLTALAPLLKKAFPGTHFCCGGLMATVDPEAVIALDGIDSLVIGEAEGALVDFLSAFYREKDYGAIRNFWVKTASDTFTKNPLRNLIQDLDLLPFPDRSFYAIERLIDITDGALPVIASRGCDYNCLFCPYPHIREIYRGKGDYIRKRSVGNIISEIQKQLACINFSSILFVDEIFPTSKDWLAEFAERYRTQVNLPFSITSSVEKLDSKVLELLRKAGCSTITLGIETGNEAFRKRISDRNVGNEKILQTVSAIHRAGIKVCVTNMLGLPLETADLARETHDFNKKIDPECISVSIFYPVPSTPLYNYCSQKGYISKRDSFRLKPDESVLDLPYISPETIRKYYSKILMLGCHQRVLHAGEPGGFFDLLHTLAKEETEEATLEPITCDEFSLNKERHFALAQFPNTKLTFPVTLKEKAYINFGIGIEPVIHKFKPDAFFRFTLVLIQNGKEQVLFEKYLNPGKNEEDLKWFLYELPLFDAAAGEGFLRLEYRTSLRSHYPLCGLWVSPFLTDRLATAPPQEVSLPHKDYEETRKELLEKRMLLERSEKEKQKLSDEIYTLKQELDGMTNLVGELQVQILQLEEKSKSSEERISELEQIKKAYDKTLRARLKRLFKRK